MLKKIIPCLLLSSFISSTSLQAGACFADISEFNKLKSLHASNSASLESYYAETQKPIDSYPANAKWFLKRNQFSWVVSEFISSALYQKILGPDLIGTSYLVCDKNNENTVWIATEFQSHLVPFGAKKADLIFGDKSADGISFSCLLGGCWFTDASHIKGLEKAVLTSILLYEDDVTRGNNFGVINGTTVTRFDLDDSLKFLDIEKISPGLTASGLSSDFKSFLSKNKVSLDNYIAQVNAQTSKRARKFIQEDLKNLFPNLKGDFKPESLLKAGLDILKISPQTLHKIVDLKLKVLAEVVKPGLWKTYYKVPQDYKMHSTLDQYTKTCGAAFEEIDGEMSAPTFPEIISGIKTAIDQLAHQGFVSMEQYGALDPDSGKPFYADCDVIEFSFEKMPLHKKLATIIKAHITYHYAALYVTCKQWQSTIAKTDL